MENTKLLVDRHKKYEAIWKRQVENSNLKTLNFMIFMFNNKIESVKTKIEIIDKVEKIKKAEPYETSLPGSYYTGDVDLKYYLKTLEKDLNFVIKTKKLKFKR